MHISRRRPEALTARYAGPRGEYAEFGLLTLVPVVAMYGQMEEHSGALARLVARAQHGDAVSRDELLRTVRSGILRYLLARGLPDHDAQDVAQETCLGVLRALPTWTDRVPSVWASVFAIARNKIADRARSYAGRREVPMGHHAFVADVVTDPQAGPGELVEHDEGAQRVRALIEDLPPTQREVLLLRVIVGLSTAETAAALNLTVGSARVLQHRAVTALRTRLATTVEGTP
jgi:RNA polymerase sigma-70 factor (ECF subfamily)